MVEERSGPFQPELLKAIETVAEQSPSVVTVGRQEANRIVEVRPDGVLVETAKSAGEAQLVPAWMFEVAWRHLKERGVLESRFLQSNDGLGVKRSAAVMAVLAHLPGVSSARRPARLFLGSNDPLAMRNPAWDADERALALELYLRRGVVGKSDPELLDLSEFLRLRAEAAGTERNDAFRNPAGVSLKLANFASIDSNHEGQGMSRYSRGDIETWNELSGDRDELARRADEIFRRDAASIGPAADRFVPIEAHHVTDFVVTIDAAVRLAQRSESTLVQEFAAWLESIGRDVGSDRHDVGTGSLRPDLLDLTEQCIWEAKSEVGRNAVRLAIGQLLDYRRFRPSWTIGVLLPHRPNEDLIDLCRSIGARVAWRSRDAAGQFILDEGPTHSVQRFS